MFEGRPAAQLVREVHGLPEPTLSGRGAAVSVRLFDENHDLGAES